MGQAETGCGRRWQDKDGELRLLGCRVVILRRRLKRALALTKREASGQLRLGFAEIDSCHDIWEYAVLAASLASETHPRPALAIGPIARTALTN